MIPILNNATCNCQLYYTPSCYFHSDHVPLYLLREYIIPVCNLTAIWVLYNVFAVYLSVYRIMLRHKNQSFISKGLFSPLYEEKIQFSSISLKSATLYFVFPKLLFCVNPYSQTSLVPKILALHAS